MKHAIKDVAMHKKGLMQAAREYDVPVTTLKRRIDGFMPYVWVDEENVPETFYCNNCS